METSKKGVLCGITVEPVLFLFSFAQMAWNGLNKDLIYTKVCQQQYNTSICDNIKEYDDVRDYVQTEASYWIMISHIVLIVPSMFFSLYLGSWSDRFGRKLPILLPLVGGTVSTSIYIFISAYYYAPVWLVVPANFLIGAFGGGDGIIVSCMTYLSNVTKEKNRIVRFSRGTAMSSLGGTAGPFFSGTVIQYIGRSYTFACLLVIYALNIFYVSVFIENIKPDVVEKKSGSFCSRYFSLNHVKDSFATVFKKRDGNKRKMVLLLFLAHFVTVISMTGQRNILFLYTADEPLNWNYTTYSYYNSFRQLINTFALLALMPIAKMLKISDLSLCILAILSRASGMTLLGFSHTTVMVFCVPILKLFMTFCMAGTRSQLSIIVGKSEQGRTFSFMGISTNLSSILSALIYNSTYPLTRSFFNGLLFEISAAILIIPFTIYCWLWIDSKEAVKEEENKEEKKEEEKPLTKDDLKIEIK